MFFKLSLGETISCPPSRCVMPAPHIVPVSTFRSPCRSGQSGTAVTPFATPCPYRIFVATNTILSRQKYACYDKCFIATNTCLSRQKLCCNNKYFVATSILLSRQKTFCRDKHVFVATKMILVAAPTRDK